MLVTCWSVKGGSGTTVVAAALGLMLGGVSARGSLLIDAAGGDLAAVFGFGDSPGPGLAEWLASPTAEPTALARLEVPASPGVALLMGGASRPQRLLAPVGSEIGSSRDLDLAGALLDDARAVVVDAGVVADPLTRVLCGASAVSLLVIRPCYLALRRAVAAPQRPTGVVLVRESGRALRRSDVESALGVPVRAEVDIHASVARLIDCGLFASRFPRSLARALRQAA